MNILRSALCAMGLLLAIGLQPARAALGESAASVQSDVTALRGAASTQTSARRDFTVQRMVLPSATMVDEYVSPSGIVFAVTWRGQRPPDLSRLFGAYFSEYQAVAAQPHQRHSRVRVDTGGLIYQAGGHMRSYWGTAYAPALMPAGVTEDNLQ